MYVSAKVKEPLGWQATETICIHVLKSIHALPWEVIVKGPRMILRDRLALH